jgi:hypothetical protein
MRDDLVALHGRSSSGIAVQLLWSRVDGGTHITVVWGDRDQTFEVDPADALEAFHHPFVYGCTLEELRHVPEADLTLDLSGADPLPV